MNIRYTLGEIGSDWNEVLDDYLEAKSRNKQITWHDWYMDRAERRKRITRLFDELQTGCEANNEIIR